jgi:hypothetical protein
VSAVFVGSTMDVEVEAEPTSDEVVDRVNEILGYDVLADPAEGYREMADEALALAESNLGTAVEALDLDD